MSYGAFYRAVANVQDITDFGKADFEKTKIESQVFMFPNSWRAAMVGRTNYDQIYNTDIKGMPVDEWYNESQIIRDARAETAFFSNSTTKHNLSFLHILQLNMFYNCKCTNGVGAGTCSLVCGNKECIADGKRCGLRTRTINPFKVSKYNIQGIAVLCSWLKIISNSVKKSEAGVYSYIDPFSGVY